jgi:hypothetical protein
MPLRPYLIAVCGILLLLTSGACKKNKGADPAPQEQGIEFSFDGVLEGKYNPSPGATYPFKLNITSTIPAQGVNVVVTAATEQGNVSVQQDAVPGPVKSSPVTITLKGLASLKTLKVMVTVTSVSKADNTKTKEFFITNKS